MTTEQPEVSEPKPIIIDGKVCCPDCETHNLVYACDVPYYGEVRLNENGAMESHSTKPSHDLADNYRLFCGDCDGVLTDPGIDGL